MTYEFKLPDIGEGLTEGEVVKWHVKVGDSVKENQPLCNVLTDKAEVEIPSPKTGTIAKLFAQEGQKVLVHAPLVSFELSGNGSSASGSSPSRTPSEKASATGAAPASKGPAAASGANVLATPLVRKLAADLKVDLASVQGTGPGGRVTEQDVRNAANGTAPSKTAPSSPPKTGSSAIPSVGEDRIPFVGIRRKIAEKMMQSRKTVAHVTHMDEADLTALVALREELKPEAAKKGVKLTYLPFIIKALVKSLKEFPSFNATLDEAAGAIIRKRAYNIGIATTSDNGLIVPVVKAAEGKDVWGLAAEINRLADKVRAGKVEVAELQGGTFTITNIGPIGGLFATPIVNHPEVAILGVMKIQKRPMVKDGAIQVRDMVNLVLSFDHRVVDGADAAYFMNTIVKHLENPRTLL